MEGTERPKYQREIERGRKRETEVSHREKVPENQDKSWVDFSVSQSHLISSNQRQLITLSVLTLISFTLTLISFILTLISFILTLISFILTLISFSPFFKYCFPGE